MVAEPSEDEASEATLLLLHSLWGQNRYSEMLNQLNGKTGAPGYDYWRARAHFELHQYGKGLKGLNLADESMAKSRYAPSALRLKGSMEQLTGKLDEAEAHRVFEYLEQIGELV